MIPFVIKLFAQSTLFRGKMFGDTRDRDQIQPSYNIYPARACANLRVTYSQERDTFYSGNSAWMHRGNSRARDAERVRS